MIVPEETPITLAQIVQVVFLQDEQGSVQVAFPCNRLLDLSLLNRFLQRTLTPIAEKRWLAAVRQGRLPAFPHLPKRATLIQLLDERLLEPSVLYEHKHLQIKKVKMEQFVDYQAQARIGDFTSPLPRLPIDPAQDLVQIQDALTRFTQLRIQQRLSETFQLPPLPEIASRIIELRTSTHAGPRELAAIAGVDPILSAQILSWARSPYYGVEGEITTIEEAVVRVLGFDLVLNLALGLVLSQTLAVPKDGPDGYTPFWQQSVVTSVFCSELIKHIPLHLRPQTGLSHLCGLLHNFGNLILAHVFPPQYQLINRYISANPHIPSIFIEQHLLGINREQIAATLLDQWHTPKEVVYALRQQHNPRANGEHAPYALLLYIAARALKEHNFGDGPLEPIPEYVLDALKIDKKTVNDVTLSVLERLPELGTLARKISP